MAMALNSVQAPYAAKYFEIQTVVTPLQALAYKSGQARVLRLSKPRLPWSIRLQPSTQGMSADNSGSVSSLVCWVVS
jgi:hypothetical protein